MASIYCELCGLPHQVTAVVCEACEHRLGAPVNWGGVRARARVARNKFLLGVFVSLGFFLGNAVYWESGWILISFSPVLWTVWYGNQYRLLRTRLRDAKKRELGVKKRERGAHLRRV